MFNVQSNYTILPKWVSYIADIIRKYYIFHLMHMFESFGTNHIKYGEILQHIYKP